VRAVAAQNRLMTLSDEIRLVAGGCQCVRDAVDAAIDSRSSIHKRHFPTRYPPRPAGVTMKRVIAM
jgi:hypothetical protein